MSADVILGRLGKGYGGPSGAPNSPSITPPTSTGSFGLVDPLSALGQWALKSTGQLGTDAATFAEQDIIRPLETVGRDVYNVGDTFVDGIRYLFTFGKNVNSTVSTVNDLTKKVGDFVTKVTNPGQQGISLPSLNLNLGQGGGAPVDLSGLLGGLANFFTPQLATPGGSSGGSYLLLGGLIVGAGLVVYLISRKR